MVDVPALFTPQELAPIQDGIRKYLRLINLPIPEWQIRFIADESDLYLTLDSIRRSFHDTRRMLNKSMYQGRQFDPCEDVLDRQESYLLTGKTEQDTAVARRTFTVLYFVVVEPLVKLFSKYDHATILLIVDQVIDYVKEFVASFEDYGTADDAVIAKAQTQRTIAAREEQRKIEKAARKRATRRKTKAEVENLAIEMIKVSSGDVE